VLLTCFIIASIEVLNEQISDDGDDDETCLGGSGDRDTVRTDDGLS